MYLKIKSLREPAKICWRSTGRSETRSYESRKHFKRVQREKQTGIVSANITWARTVDTGCADQCYYLYWTPEAVWIGKDRRGQEYSNY